MKGNKMYLKFITVLIALSSLTAFAASETDKKDDEKVERAFFVAMDHEDHGEDHGDAGEEKKDEQPAEESKKIEYDDKQYYPKK
jgi:hypothetical protein